MTESLPVICLFLDLNHDQAVSVIALDAGVVCNLHRLHVATTPDHAEALKDVCGEPSLHNILASAIAEALQILEGRMRRAGVTFSSPTTVKDYLVLQLAEHEPFARKLVNSGPETGGRYAEFPCTVCGVFDRRTNIDPRAFKVIQRGYGYARRLAVGKKRRALVFDCRGGGF